MNIAVTSPSFSKHPKLIKEIKKISSNVKLNTVGERFEGEALYEYVKNAEVLVVGLERMDKALLSRLPKLKMISKYGVGLNNIDLDYCKANDIRIGWKGGVNKLSVAEMTLGFMLMLCRNLYITSNQLKKGTWNKTGGFQLSGKTVGIIGVGSVGKEVIRLLRPFGCKIYVNDIIDQTEFYDSLGLIEKSKVDIFREADIISLHTPLNEHTTNLINEATLREMKNTALVINTSRGEIVNETNLKQALLTDQIGGAAIDVYSSEPPGDQDLLNIPNLITTPHIGGNSIEAVEAMGMSAIDEIVEFYNLI
jgi:phosphoglycerate dehydrogenase-like enzyme